MIWSFFALCAILQINFKSACDGCLINGKIKATLLMTFTCCIKSFLHTVELEEEKKPNSADQILDSNLLTLPLGVSLSTRLSSLSEIPPSLYLAEMPSVNPH